MRTTHTTRILTAFGGALAALSLSACGMTITFGGEEEAPGTQQEETQPQEDTDPAQEQDDVQDDGGAASSGANTSDTSGGADGSEQSSDSSTGTGSSGGFTLDENGTGTIPAGVLEEHIEQAYGEQGVTVDSVECRSDMSVWNETGSSSCTVTAQGREHYGVAKVTSVSGQNVYYELSFPSVSDGS